MCVICVMRLMFVAYVVCDHPLDTVAKAIDLVAFEHAVILE